MTSVSGNRLADALRDVLRVFHVELAAAIGVGDVVGWAILERCLKLHDDLLWGTQPRLWLALGPRSRGRARGHDGDALQALKDAVAELLSKTVALAQVGERMASDASSEAARVRPDLAQRFSAVRAGCARAGVGLRTGRLGFGAGAAGGDC